MGKVTKGVLSTRHLLILSLAVNLGLLVRVAYERPEAAWNRKGGLHSLHGFCLVDKLNRGTSSIDDDFSAPVSKKTRSSTSSVASTQVTDGGEDDNVVINLDHGDPTMYEKFWQQIGEKTTVVISGWQYISYFSDINNLCWFLEPEFANAVIRLHKVVGNAITEDRHIVVGTGSSQLFQALLYALSPPNTSKPMNVVSAAPFYSSYPLMTDYLKSGLYKWAGDAYKFAKDQPYIELVTSPNNPDGSIRQAVVNGDKGILIHDLAYYWPQYTPISSPADHDIMLFTVSKSTGHAGARIGWALVKDREIAKKMTTFIEINTIGVSKDSQIRAAKILQTVSNSYDHGGNPEEEESFFDYSYNLMENRWKKLRAAVNKSGQFSLPNFPLGTCTFSGRYFEPQPAFAWLKCEGQTEDCESFLRGQKILTRGGQHFGVSPRYVRISVLSRDKEFDLFTDRLSIMNS